MVNIDETLALSPCCHAPCHPDSPASPWRPNFETVGHLATGVRKKRWHDSASLMSLKTKFDDSYAFLERMSEKSGPWSLHATYPWRPNLTPRQPASPAVHEVCKLISVTQGGFADPVARRSSQTGPQSSKPTGAW